MRRLLAGIAAMIVLSSPAGTRSDERKADKPPHIVEKPDMKGRMESGLPCQATESGAVVVKSFFAKMAKEQGIAQEEMEKQFIAQHRPTSLLRRLATPEEVANMVVYVCSPQASATNGAALRVDGGVVRTIV